MKKTLNWLSNMLIMDKYVHSETIDVDSNDSLCKMKLHHQIPGILSPVFNLPAG